MKWFLPLAFMLFAAAPAIACRGDRDCPAPNRCHFAEIGKEGMCLDTSAIAIARSVKAPHASPLRERKEGDVCQFTVDCGVGAACFRAPGSAEGLCYAPPAAVTQQRRLKR